MANGGFTEKHFEVLSFISGDVKFLDSKNYRVPTERLPDSETAGTGDLEVLGSLITNIPSGGEDYVKRKGQEEELKSALLDDHHPIVTLLGRGGIGKTSLAITAIRNIASTSRFEFAMWFSARDLDLLPSGPKPVAPAVLDIRNMADALVRVVARDEKTPTEYFAKCLKTPELGASLFIIDNFETVANQKETFEWIDDFVRPPNKVLITTRLRSEFRADFPITVSGMTEMECSPLIERTAKRLGINDKVTSGYRTNLFSESEGHPYVIKNTSRRGKKDRKIRGIIYNLSHRAGVAAPVDARVRS